MLKNVLLLILSFFILIFNVVSASANNDFDGRYNSKFQFRMGAASVCPQTLPIEIELQITNNKIVGTMFNNGGGNTHQFCRLYHNGSIRGTIKKDGFISLKVKQNDPHSMEFSSYKIMGKLDDKLTLLSRNSRYHPPHRFSLIKRGSSKKANKVQTNDLNSNRLNKNEIICSERVGFIKYLDEYLPNSIKLTKDFIYSSNGKNIDSKHNWKVLGSNSGSYDRGMLELNGWSVYKYNLGRERDKDDTRARRLIATIQSPDSTDNPKNIIYSKCVTAADNSQNIKNDSNLSNSNLKKLCGLFTPGLELNTKTYKSLQKNLKTLGYYKGGIDGLFGKGSCKALNSYRSATMVLATPYFSKSLFDRLQRNANAEIKLADKKIYINEDASVCDKATILQNGIRRWNLDNPKAIKQVKSRGLDCNITVSNTPFTQKEAKYFLLQLTDFVSKNPSKFDLSFSSEFNKVRGITNGEWNVSLSREFEFFRIYVSKFEGFLKYLEDIRLAEKATEKKRIEQLRASISQSMAILKEWAQKNVLDEKSAQIAALESQIGMKGNQSINSLEQLLDDAQRLLAASGINDSTDGDASQLVSTACLKTDITQCSDNLICEKATIISDGIRRWNFEQPKLIQQVKSRGLDCKITIDTSPFNQQEAKYFLSQLMTFVSENPSEFGLNFATEFNKVRDIISGKWNSNLSKTFELFRGYTSEFPLFQKYLEDMRLAEVEAKQVRLEQLRETAVQDMIVLREWAQKNVLDEKAAQIASLDAKFGDKNIQTINGLEQLIAETKRLFSATGIKDTVAQNQTNEIVNSLYDPSSIYLFANISGDATNLYKNLDGEFSFEQAEGTYCASNKLDAFDYYVLQGKIFTTFNDLSKLTSRCSASADVFVVKGNEITSDTVFNVINLGKLQQVLEVPKSERDTAFDQLNFLKETIKKDVIAGDRVGYGLLKTDSKDSSICAVIDGSEQGHVDQLQQSASLLKALSYPWNGFNKITNNAEEAFKSLQRGQCSSVYGSALTLGRLYLAGESAGINMEFMPVWMSKSAVEASQKSYDATLADSANANAKLEQSIKDKEKLDEQAQQSKAELASVRQLDLREKNGLRFMVLRDELQAQVFSAVKFAFENPADEAGYIKKYLSQSFVDQSTRYSPFDGIISDIQKLAAERWEITEQRIEQADYGKAKFNGRELDAIEVELRIASKNRLVGKYSEYCQRIQVIKDDDFEMWRNFEIGNCDVTSATRKWKNASSFESLWIVEAK